MIKITTLISIIHIFVFQTPAQNLQFLILSEHRQRDRLLFLVSNIQIGDSERGRAIDQRSEILAEPRDKCMLSPRPLEGLVDFSK